MQKILQSLSEFFVRRGWFSNIGKFKVGDKVKYNWKAKVTLGKSVNSKIHTILSIKKYSSSDNWQCGCSDGGGDVYWIRHLYFWEK